MSGKFKISKESGVQSPFTSLSESRESKPISVDTVDYSPLIASIESLDQAVFSKSVNVDDLNPFVVQPSDPVLTRLLAQASFSEEFSLASAVQLAPNKNVADSVTITTDQIQFQLDYRQTVPENVDVDDVLVPVVQFNRVFTDQLVAAEAIALDLHRPLADSTEQSTDFAAIVPTLNKQDSVSAATTQLSFTIDKVLSDDALAEDLIGVADGLVYVLSKVYLDNVGSSDDYARQVGYVRQYSDATALSTTRLINNVGKNVQSLISTTTDALSFNVIKALQSTAVSTTQIALDSAIVKEDLTSATTQIALGVTKPLASSSGVASSVSFEASRPVDSITGTTTDLSSWNFTKSSQSNTDPTTDVFNRQIDFNRVINDAVDAEDLLGIDDGLNFTFDGSKKSSTGATTDIPTLVLDWNRSFNSSTSASSDDSFLDFGKNTNEDLVSIDVLTSQVDFNRDFVDTPTPVDVLSLEMIFSRSHSSSTNNTTDTPTITVDFNRSLSENISSADEILSFVIGKNNVQDSQTAVDVLTSQVDFNRTVSDSVNTDDLIGVGDGLLYSLSKTFTESVTAATDSIVFSFVRFAEFDDAVVSSENIDFNFTKANQSSATATTEFSPTVEYNRLQPDASTVVDLLSFVVDKGVQDNVTSIDTPLFETSKSGIDSAAASSDTPTLLVNFNRLFTDAADSEDLIGVADGLLYTLSKKFNDSSVADSVFSRIVDYNRSHIDSSSTSDDFILNFTKATDSPSTPVDVFTKVVDFNRTNTETVLSVADIQSLSITKVSQETATAASTIAAFDVSKNNVTSSAGSSDLTTTITNFSRTFGDSVSSEDLVGVGDGLLYVFGKNIQEAVTSSELFNRDVQYVRSYSDSSSTIDSISKNISLLFNNDSVTAIDLATPSIVLVNGSTDSSTAADNLLVDFTKAVNDDASTASLLSRTVAFNRSVADSSTATDLYNRTVSYNRSQPDSATSVDVFNRTVSYSRAPTDSSSSVDSDIKSVGKFVSGDDATPADVYSRTVSYVRNLSDSAAADDLLGVADGLLYVLSKNIIGDSVTLGDNYSRTVSFIRDLSSSTASQTDSISIEVTLPSLSSSTGTSADTTVINSTKNLSDDTGSTTDSGDTFLQGYFVTYEDYLPDHYIGTEGTF